MQIFLKLKSGHLITIDDMREENWSPKIRKIMCWIAVAGIGITLFILLWTAP
jgi:hypothetical protein